MNEEEDRLLRDVVADTALKVAAMERRVAQADADRAEMMRMLTELHDAMMKPQPGYEKSLLQRMAAVAIASEQGKAAGERIIWWGKVIGASGAILAGLYAAIRSTPPAN